MALPLGLKILTGVVILAVIAAVGYGIYLAGSPAEQRLMRFDERRISDLRRISSVVNEYWNANKEFPPSLEHLNSPRFSASAVKDPATEEPYEYRPLNEDDEDDYELCAVFETDSSQVRYGSGRDSRNRFWEHGVGKTCFSFEKESYAPPFYGPRR